MTMKTKWKQNTWKWESHSFTTHNNLFNNQAILMKEQQYGTHTPSMESQGLYAPWLDLGKLPGMI